MTHRIRKAGFAGRELAAAVVLCGLAVALAGCPANSPPAGFGAGGDGGDHGVTEAPARLAFPARGVFTESLPATPALHPESEARVERLTAFAQHLELATDEDAVPVYYAPEEVPRLDILLGAAWRPEVEGRRTDYLIDVPLAPWAVPDPAPNRWLCVVDPDSGTLAEFARFEFQLGVWLCRWGNRIPLDGDGIYARGYSPSGSGFSMLAGVVWPEDLAAGRIGYKLAAYLPYQVVQDGPPVPPATEGGGDLSHPANLPVGAVLQLDPALDVDAPVLGLSPLEKVMARALQEYGVVVAGVGDDAIRIRAVSSLSYPENPYAPLVTERETYWRGFLEFPNIPLERLRVLDHDSPRSVERVLTNPEWFRPAAPPFAVPEVD
jgi:hypothetical protein